MTTQLQQRLEPYSFNDQEPTGLEAIDGAPGEAGSDWADIWKFQLPAGYCYHFDRSSVFAAYLQYVKEVLDGAFLDDGGAFTDETADARSAGTGDVEFVAAIPVAEDGFLFGYRFPFQALTINFSQAGTDSNIVWAWEYWNGSAWAALSGLSANAQTIWQDGTGEQTLTFSLPSGWAKREISGHNLYWVRANIDTMTTDFTAVPRATQIFANGGTQEIASGNRVRVIWTDPNEEEVRRLMGAVRYQLVTEFQQDSKLHRMDIADKILVPEQYLIKVQVAAKAPIDASASYFAIALQRSRMAIF